MFCGRREDDDGMSSASTSPGSRHSQSSSPERSPGLSPTSMGASLSMSFMDTCKVQPTKAANPPAPKSASALATRRGFKSLTVQTRRTVFLAPRLSGPQ